VQSSRSVSPDNIIYTISFIYNELEDFRITTSVSNKSLPDAIQQMIGFYPVRMIVKSDNEIFVESIHKTDRHLTGTIIDEQGQPVAYANVAVLNPADSTLLSGGVSNESGYFAIPYDHGKVLARISYVGYKTVWRLCDKPEVGTIRMHPETQRLKGYPSYCWSHQREGFTPICTRGNGKRRQHQFIWDKWDYIPNQQQRATIRNKRDVAHAHIFFCF